MTSLVIDTAPIIYFIESNPAYIARMQEVLLIAATQNLPVFTSVVTLTEVMTQPLRVGDSARAAAFRNYLLNPGISLTLTAVDVVIAERAAELRAKYNLKTPDAIQVATIIESGCDAFYITTRSYCA